MPIAYSALILEQISSFTTAERTNKINDLIQTDLQLDDILYRFLSMPNMSNLILAGATSCQDTLSSISKTNFLSFSRSLVKIRRKCFPNWVVEARWEDKILVLDSMSYELVVNGVFQSKRSWGPQLRYNSAYEYIPIQATNDCDPRIRLFIKICLRKYTLRDSRDYS